MIMTMDRWMAMLRPLSAGLLFLAMLAGESRGEIVNLRTGTPLVGKVVEARIDGLTFETHGGNVYEMRWEQVFDKDAERIKREWGLIIEAGVEEFLVPGQKILLQDGTEYQGVVLREDDRFLQLKMLNNRTPIPKELIVSQKDVTIDALSVYRPKELLDIRRKETSPQSTAELYDLAVFAQRIGAYREAKTILESVVEVDPSFEAEAIKSQMQRLEGLIANKDLLDQAERIRASHRSGLFSRALTELQTLQESHPSSPLIGDLARRRITVEKLERQIRVLTVRRVANAFFPALKDKVNEIARDRELTFAEAKNRAGKQLDDEVVAVVAEKLGLEGDEVKGFFAERPGSIKHVGNYASGSYIVHKKKKPDRSKLRGPQPRSRGRDGRGQPRRRTRTQRVKKRPVEEWWAQADISLRRRWLSAYFAEKSKLVTVIRTEFDKCSKCGGQGYRIIYATGAGSNTRALCDRCFGIGVDKKVVYK